MKNIILSLVLLLSTLSFSQNNLVYNSVADFCSSRSKEVNLIPVEKRQLLDKLAEDIVNQKSGNIAFGCLTNSRRTQLSQIWLQTAILYYGINKVNVFSAGDTQTTIPSQIIHVLRRSGFNVDKTMGCQSCYVVSIGKDETYIISSKDIKNNNVSIDSCLLVSVCSEYEQSPEFKNSEYQLGYGELTLYDNTPSESPEYLYANLVISREMIYLAKAIKTKQSAK